MRHPAMAAQQHSKHQQEPTVLFMIGLLPISDRRRRVGFRAGVTTGAPPHGSQGLYVGQGLGQVTTGAASAGTPVRATGIP